MVSHSITRVKAVARTLLYVQSYLKQFIIEKKNERNAQNIVYQFKKTQTFTPEHIPYTFFANYIIFLFSDKFFLIFKLDILEAVKILFYLYILRNKLTLVPCFLGYLYYSTKRWRENAFNSVKYFCQFYQKFNF